MLLLKIDWVLLEFKDQAGNSFNSTYERVTNRMITEEVSHRIFIMAQELVLTLKELCVYELDEMHLVLATKVHANISIPPKDTKTLKGWIHWWGRRRNLFFLETKWNLGRIKIYVMVPFMPLLNKTKEGEWHWKISTQQDRSNINSWNQPSDPLSTFPPL